MLADDLLEDAKHLAGKGAEEKRKSCLRRAVSTAYYAVFHLLIEDFVGNWPFEEQRPRLARMFNHGDMRKAVFRPHDTENPTLVEKALIDVIAAFGELQGKRHRADYDLAWNIVDTDAQAAVTRAEAAFVAWRSIRTENAARQHLLSMFGAKDR